MSNINETKPIKQIKDYTIGEIMDISKGYINQPSLQNLYVEDHASHTTLSKNQINSIIKIYEKRFNTKLSDRDVINWFRNGNVISVTRKKTKDKKDPIIAFGRWFRFTNLRNYKKIKDNELFKQYFKLDDFLFLSDLASIDWGGGKAIMLHLCKIADEKNLTLFTVPWKDNLIVYYKKYGFQPVYPDTKLLPSVIMVRKPNTQ